MTQTMKIGAVIATGAMVLSQLAAIPAYACGYSWCGGSQGDDNEVTIVVKNSGTITNETEAKADTGDNYAGGSYGGDAGDAGRGGRGGDAEVEGGGLDWCSESCDGGASNTATGGDGGNGGDVNGGDAGEGGLVETGDATAEAGTVNKLNTVDVEVEGCGCEPDNSDVPPWFQGSEDNEVKIIIDNNGNINNETEAKADTGDNAAKGSYGGDAYDAGNGGSGGEAEVEDGRGHRGYEGCGCGEFPEGTGDATGGEGGEGGDVNGGDGDIGGTVRTGDARSESGTVNVMNTVFTRVTR